MRTVKSDDFKVNVRGIKIDRCFATKYLGVLLDENLSWKPHIEYLQKKLSQSVGIIAQMRKYLDNTNLVALYYSFFFLMFYTVFLVEVAQQKVRLDLYKPFKIKF